MHGQLQEQLQLYYAVFSFEEIQIWKIQAQEAYLM